MKLDVFDKTGKAISNIELSDNVFGVIPNQTVLAQYVRVFLANQRQGTSSTKTRAERRGGGKKPWRQKGTGRARHGSSRSPIWRKGGVSHGPKPKSWTLDLSKKLKRVAMVSVLSAKHSSSALKILDKVELDTPKTKYIADIMKNLNVTGNALFVIKNDNETTRKSAQNIDGLKVSSVENLNAYEVLRARNVVFLEDSIKLLNDKYATK